MSRDASWSATSRGSLCLRLAEGSAERSHTLPFQWEHMYINGNGKRPEQSSTTPATHNHAGVVQHAPMPIGSFPNEAPVFHHRGGLHCATPVLHSNGKLWQLIRATCWASTMARSCESESRHRLRRSLQGRRGNI
jgi:hypothetical protein